MQVYEKLTLPIQSRASQEIPLSVQHTLLYYWKASHKFALTSPVLSHVFAREFMELSRFHCAGMWVVTLNNCNFNIFHLDYSETVTQRICKFCSVLLLSGITSTSKIKTIKRSRKINKAGSENKIANQLVSKFLISFVKNLLYEYDDEFEFKYIICQSSELLFWWMKRIFYSLD